MRIRKKSLRKLPGTFSTQPELGMGRHAGKPLREIPESYLRYVLNARWVTPRERDAIEAELRRRTNG
jgi:hypothetical protein